MGTRFKSIRTLADMQGALNDLDDKRVTTRRIRLIPDAAATANINVSATPANGEIITIDDGEGNVETFEFTDGGGASGSNIEVDKSSTITDGMAELKTAIDGSTLNIVTGTVGGSTDLPLTHGTQGAVGNTATMTTDVTVATLTQFSGGQNGNLTAAAASQTIAFAAALDRHTLVLAAIVDLDGEFSGGSVSAVTVDVGTPADPNFYVAAEDVFTGAGTGYKQGSPGVGFSTLAGAPFNPGPLTPEVTINTTGGDVADLDAGDLSILLLTVSPPPNE